MHWGNSYNRTKLLKNEQEVVRMMQALQNIVENQDLFFGTKSQENASRLNVLSEKLTEMGYPPIYHPDEDEWRQYLSLILPYVEEDGVARAREITESLPSGWFSRR